MHRYVTHGILPSMGGGDLPVVLAFKDAQRIQDGTGSWTFASMDIGAAVASRFVIVGVYAPSTSTDSSDAISGVTIGGVAANRLAQATTNPGTGEENHQIAFYGLLVPTGVTADIVVSSSVDRASLAVSVWTATGLSSTTPTDIASDVVLSSKTLSAAIDVDEGGFIIGIGMTQNRNETCTWVGLGNDFDIRLLPGSPVTSAEQIGAYLSDMTAATVNVSATWTAIDGGGDNALLLIAMR